MAIFKRKAAPKAKAGDTKYVTVALGKRGSLYTYSAEGVSNSASVAWVDTRNGVRPAPIVSVSDKPPSKDPAPDGYKGRVASALRVE